MLQKYKDRVEKVETVPFDEARALSLLRCNFPGAYHDKGTVDKMLLALVDEFHVTSPNDTIWKDFEDLIVKYFCDPKLSSSSNRDEGEVNECQNL